jgi:hypothetical protein
MGRKSWPTGAEHDRLALLVQQRPGVELRVAAMSIANEEKAVGIGDEVERSAKKSKDQEEDQ